MMRWKHTATVMILAGLSLASTPGYGQWPERGLTLVSSPSTGLPWAPDVPDPQLTIIKELLPRLSRELGVPVSLAEELAGREILSANLVAGARPDGYLLGALEADPVISWEIQGYTPYTRHEFTPVATAWRVVYAIVVPAGNPAADLRALGRDGQQPRLAHTGLEPVNIDTVMAMEAARAAGFKWTLTKVDRLDPELLLLGQAEALVLPLGRLKLHPRADQFKVLTVLGDSKAPCAGNWPTLESQSLAVEPNALVSFYLPNKVNWRIRSRLSTALNNALRQPAVIRRLDEACLIPYIEDLEGAVDAADREYARETARLRAQDFSTPEGQ